MSLELPPTKIWRNRKNKFWYRGIDPSSVEGCYSSSIDAFESIRDHAVMFGYSREVILESVTGQEVHTRVG